MRKTLMLCYFAFLGLINLSFANTNFDFNPDPCPCDGGYIEIQLFYFGPDNVTINAYSDNDLNPQDLIVSFPNVSSGDLLVVNGAALPGGKLGIRTYLSYTVGEEVCTTSIYSRCPTNVYPNATEELKILGKTFGHFTVYAHTDEGNNLECTLDNADQDWHVGGNVVGPAKKTLGTRNNEDVVIITNDTPRGIITRTGDLGWGTQAPSTDFDLQGNALINETLTVNGQTSINDVTQSTTFTNGALTVAGGVGIERNVNIGEELEVDGRTQINDVTESNTHEDGALVVSGGIGVGGNANVNNFLVVGQDATIGNNLSVVNDGNFGNNLTVAGNGLFGEDLAVIETASIGQDLNVGQNTEIQGNLVVNQLSNLNGNTTINGFALVDNNARVTGNANVQGTLSLGNSESATLSYNGFSDELLIENQVGEVIIEAANEEMLIIDNTQVEAKKRIVVTGADLAERFTVNKEEDTALLPGMVVSIDKNTPGALTLSKAAYEKTVAGIVSGAGGIQTAMLLGQEGTLADGEVPVAIVGRVYCYVDASFGAIEAGDLLTTSPTLGHAMKVTDFEAAQGAIIGKAMTSLKEGKGMVLVLISMQ